ncbi:MAG: hypothetical protein GY870_21715 [archaeon]|nr:hypothetical protein [archaeon]
MHDTEELIGNFFETMTFGLKIGDINENIQFYTKILGFNVIAKYPTKSLQPKWVIMVKNNVAIHFQKSDKNIKKNTSMSFGFIRIQIHNIKSFHNSLKDKKIKISSLETSIFGVYEFSIIDPNGFKIFFSEFLENRANIHKSNNLKKYTSKYDYIDGKKYTNIKYCTECGSKNIVTSIICENCGSILKT